MATVKRAVIANAFSLNMLMGDVTLDVMRANELFVRKLVVGADDGKRGFRSIVGHADTATVFSGILGAMIPVNRETYTFNPETDLLVVGQYSGPRLPEGATSLPEGARITWWIIQAQ